jgi:multidrug resistance efflux pump
MLNLSNNRVDKHIKMETTRSYRMLYKFKLGRSLAYTLIGLFIIGDIILFLPWTQNIKTRGNVTALHPEQRPQTIHSTIPGRIEKWYVAEGDFVKAGDTIVFLSEIKEAYFDPNLLDRTEKQVQAKESSVIGYEEKINALDRQIDAINQSMTLKLAQTRNKIEQLRLKVQSDSMNFIAAQTDFKIAGEQMKRYEELFAENLISKTDLEKRRLKLQETQAKLIEYENKWVSGKNERLNAVIELGSVENEYRDKLSKSESDKFSALSNLFEGEAEVIKLQNQYSNYSVRAQYYYITAPQDGYITRALTTGLGETIKEGDPIVTVMPSNYELAAELFVEPMDLPLININQEVRLLFDGWPTLVFSGWPGASFGTFGGRVVAIDNMISDNGKFRILVKPDSLQEAWPNALRVGAGVEGFALLNDVPVWYELWRNLNGFPPDFYTQEKENKKEDKNDGKK